MPEPTSSTTYLCEVEVTPGLESITERELRDLGAQIVRVGSGEIDFRFAGNLRALLRLQTVQTVALIQPYAVPRPRALLSNEYVPQLLRQIEIARSLAAPDAYRTFFVAAAGSETSIMQRIKALIAEQTRLAPGSEKGDLWIRIRPGRVGQGGWETVVRLSPRPLVTRPWRVCNLEGALNAAAAQALVRLTRPQANDTFVNLGCGSGTLLIERLTHSRCRSAIGIDVNPAHLACAHANIDASRQTERIRLIAGDVRALPLPSASADALCADLPFGQLSGTHAENVRLYPQILAEAGRIARTGARFVAITHEIRLLEGLLAQHERWDLEQTLPVNLRGLHPRVYVMRRR